MFNNYEACKGPRYDIFSSTRWEDFSVRTRWRVLPQSSSEVSRINGCYERVGQSRKSNDSSCKSLPIRKLAISFSTSPIQLSSSTSRIPTSLLQQGHSFLPAKTIAHIDHNMNSKSSLCALLYACVASNYANAFGVVEPTVARTPLIQRNEWKQRVEIELPDFDLLFDRIQTASPLAKQVMEGNTGDGFASVVDDGQLKWKKVEANARKNVHHIDKLDSFQNVKVPLLRFRSTIKGPCEGDLFSKFIMDIDERRRWDDQLANQEEMYPIDPRLAVSSTVLGDVDRFGECERIGVGYVQTKQGIISPREQLILGGHQRFSDGSTILWGTEMEEQHNHLLPPGQRHTRAKSHLFAATLTPTGDKSFDVEYLLQMDVGGGLPHFMTTPAIVDAVKKLFNHAAGYFEGGEGSELDLYLKSKHEDKKDFVVKVIDDDLDAHPHHQALRDSESLLFTP